jgi:hypothetical protein
MPRPFTAPLIPIPDLTDLKRRPDAAGIGLHHIRRHVYFLYLQFQIYCCRTNSMVVFVACVTGLLVIEVIFSIPTALFASIVTVHDKHYCEIDLGSVASGDTQQQAISIFYLLYSAVFSFWLPLVVRMIISNQDGIDLRFYMLEFKN